MSITAPHSVSRIPMFDPEPALRRAEAAIDRNVADMRAAGQYILGAQVRSFEAELAAAFGAGYAVGAGSGTAAIELCLREAGVVRREQEVIVPAFTSLFTAQAVLAAGASLRFADVDAGTLLLTPEAVRRAWTKQTAAVLCVHLYGNVCRLDQLAAICQERRAVLVQDACQAHGATFGGRPLTDFSPCTAYSFYPTKNLGCLGDGGAVVTNSSRVARRIRLLRDGGRNGDQLARAPGINSRLDEIHACYLRALLPHLAHWATHRRGAGDVCDRILHGCEGARPVTSSGESARHLYVIRAARRAALREALASRGIETGVHYPVALHRHPAFRKRATWLETPLEAERAAAEVVSLPSGPHVTEEEAAHIAGLVRSLSR
ncbi:MAG: DegT/DnrJ/EryC1/StrS family aminotransferase [Acidobacteriota bacterium]